MDPLHCCLFLSGCTDGSQLTDPIYTRFHDYSFIDRFSTILLSFLFSLSRSLSLFLFLLLFHCFSFFFSFSFSLSFSLSFSFCKQSIRLDRTAPQFGATPKLKFIQLTGQRCRLPVPVVELTSPSWKVTNPTEIDLITGRFNPWNITPSFR